MAQPASASLPSSAESSSARRWKYDVFLSFRGEDVRKTFLSHLYHDLQHVNKIQTFKDDTELEVGAPISPSLLKAIEDSRLAIVVLSPNYASSCWCLEELTRICQCMEDNNRILPIFYHVYPNEVRKQKGSFEAAFTKHEEDGQDKEKVKRWRDALVKVSNFSGWHTQNYKSERELLNEIAKFICSKVRPIGIEFSMSMGDFEAFEATKQAMHEVMEALKDDKVTSIAVYGMGGVGKTTMVECVGVQAQNSGIFHHVIMVVISQRPNLWKIQGTLVDLLGLEFKKESNIRRAINLKNEIMRRDKILIILDDIWDRIDLSSIGIPSYDKLKICNTKVLFTTRRRNVCDSMEVQRSIHLNILSKRDSWNFFVKKAGRTFKKSTEAYHLARKVASECAGLPIALTAVARALGKKDLEEWRDSARRFEMAQPTSFDDKGDVYKCIKLSYDYLDSTDAKSCFLLCCLFPKDHDILIEDLMKYGFGKGLFRGVNRNHPMQKVRATTKMVVKYLVASSLLLEGAKDGCVRMHDVFRDMAMSIAFSEDGHGFMVRTHCALKQWPMDVHEGYSAISLMENDICKLPQELVCSRLKILLLKSNRCIKEIPKAYFGSRNALSVLDLSGTSICLLPSSFNLLKNLKALYLDYCESLIDVSILGNLKNLEILSMREWCIEEFPKEIGHLTNLRMLDFTKGGLAIVPSQVISRLHRLEELYMKCKFGDWGRNVGGCFFAGFEELTGLSHLNILEASISSPECLPRTVEFDANWVNFGICINRVESFRTFLQPRHYTRSLSLDVTIHTLPDWFTNVVVNKAETLSYIGCKGLNSIVVEHDRGRLQRLKSLTISVDLHLKELLNTESRVSNEPIFKRLEELHVEEMSCLEELCVGELPPGSLCNLKELEIIACPNLVNVLLPSKLLQRLQNLEVLSCDRMAGMKYIFQSEEMEPEHILTKLRKMELSGAYDLISIWKGPAPPAIFQNLKSLVVHGCSGVGNIFTSDVAQCLLQLEDIWLVRCFSLDRVVEASKEMLENKKIVFPVLKKLHLEDLPQLTRFCSVTGSATSVDIECPSLEHLYVRFCPKLLTSASDFKGGNHVQATQIEQLK